MRWRLMTSAAADVTAAKFTMLVMDCTYNHSYNKSTQAIGNSIICYQKYINILRREIFVIRLNGSSKLLNNVRRIV